MEKSGEIERHITKEHHKLIELFLGYRKRTDGRLAQMDKMEARDKLLTFMHTFEAPVKEAMYGMEE